MSNGAEYLSESTELREILEQIAALREAVLQEGAARLAQWGAPAQEGAFAPAAANMAHYVALRGRDLSRLQQRLAARGLSSLGRSEAKVVPSLDALIATLERLSGEASTPYPSALAMRAGEDALREACDRLFGTKAGGPHTRVMVTLPAEAAKNPQLVEDLLAAGMDCARINCAHDDADAWANMIANIRAAETRTDRRCKILMDLAGPKCRVDDLRAPEKYRLQVGETFSIVSKIDRRAGEGVFVSLNFPSIVDLLREGATVFIDDGKARARVIEKSPGRARLEVVGARAKGVRLKIGKGLNFPDVELDLPPLTAKDFLDLDFVAAHADLVGYSFVQRPSDIELLQDHLAARRVGKPPQGLVLKIETALAVRNLPELIVRSAAQHPTAVMIARGDLAVELGFARLSEMQEEILWLCEAAHIPVVWATQVLDEFVKEGVASRAETTDAALAQRADCVMLNKGPHIVEGVAFLCDILNRMDRHYAKKFARFTPLRAWR